MDLSEERKKQICQSMYITTENRFKPFTLLRLKIQNICTKNTHQMRLKHATLIARGTTVMKHKLKYNH